MTPRLDSDRAQRGLLATWSLYMGWFVWFYGCQIALLYLQIDRSDVEGRRLSQQLWIGYNLSGVVIALLVARHTWRLGRAIPSLGFPVGAATAGALLNGLALAGNCLIWYHLLGRP